MALVVALQQIGAQEEPRLSVELNVETVPISKDEIGVSKLYKAILANNSGTTQYVNQCEYAEDDGAKLVIVPVALQHWNERAERWETVSEHQPDYCRGDGFTAAHMLKTAIAPGHSLEAAGEFAGVEDEFAFGDRGRFIVFLKAPGDYDHVVISPEFQIDEYRTKRLRPRPNWNEPVIVSAEQSQTENGYIFNIVFIIPEEPNYTFDLLKVYSTRIVEDRRLANVSFPSLHGSWKPNDRVKFSVHVPKEDTDLSKGWHLTFCIGSTESCIPSANVLDFVAHKMDR